MAQSIEVELIFKNADGKRKIFNILAPKAGLTKVEADKAMNDVITADIFDCGGSKLSDIVTSRQRTTTLEPLV